MPKPKYYWWPTCYMPMYLDRIEDTRANAVQHRAQQRPDINGNGHSKSFVIAFNEDQAKKMMVMRGLGEDFAKFDTELPWTKKWHTPRIIRRDTQSNSYYCLLKNRLRSYDWTYGATSHFHRVSVIVQVALFTGQYAWQELLREGGIFSPGVSNTGYNAKMVEYVREIETSLPGFTLEYAEKFNDGTV